ncbi:Hypothetical protein PHPALM_15805, partial [Phytophthora palmivora]
MLTVRSLVRAIFDERPTPPPPQRKVRDGYRDVSDPESEPPYEPKRFEGEYNVCFRRKPLGVGLVPSSQLYGSWEVSSVQETEAADDRDKANIAKGDVLIAINFSCRKAQLT